jgi:hypothetical protein
MADQIALYAVYFPVLRNEIYSFVNIWNSHKIRPQKNRPNAVVGRPYMLYFNPPPPTENWGTSYDAEMLANLESHLPEWDVTAFLPTETLSWCTNQLKTLNFDPYEAKIETLEQRQAPFYNIYIQLRSQIIDHMERQSEPTLGLLPHPTGNWEWQVSIVQALKGKKANTNCSSLLHVQKN